MRDRISRLPREVWALGAVSFLTDTASDMVYPLLPKLLESLGGGAIALGMMEGTAELLASFLKVWAGRASDRRGVRGPFVVFGYLLAALARPLFAWVTAPWQVVLVRSVDRIGKGVRSAPRDAVIDAVTDEKNRGLAFGVHRAMDNFGAVAGPGVAWSLLALGVSVRGVFLCAVVPGTISAFIAYLAVRGEQTKRTKEKAGPIPDEPRLARKADPEEVPRRLGRQARRLLVATAVFALACSADSFLMARLIDLRMPLALVPIAWITLQAAKALLNVPGGALADRLGPRRVLAGSWFFYALSYALFAHAPTWGTFWAILPLYALHYGLGEGAEKSWMARLCPRELRGRAFGAQAAMHGVALLPANVGFGFLYAREPKLAFVASAALAIVATTMLGLVADRDDAVAVG